MQGKVRLPASAPAFLDSSPSFHQGAVMPSSDHRSLSALKLLQSPRAGVCPHPRTSWNRQNRNSTRKRGGQERGGWEKEREGKHVIPDLPRDSWLLKHREILTAGWIEGAGATHDSERFLTAEPGPEAFIKGRRGEPSSTSRQFKGAILFPSSVPGRTPPSIFVRLFLCPVSFLRSPRRGLE